tara:strand:- start:39 stop:641 length:603 start_codon:yes stop_codon:yes gene_type:complete
MTYRIGSIYRITKNDDPTINYIGSTFTTLRQRWKAHKSTKRTKNCSISKYLDEYGRDQFKIILIKEYLVYAENQKDSRHLRAYEQLWINKFRFKKCCINKQDALPLLKKEKKKQYYQNNKEQIKEQSNEYQEAHKEQILERKKKYRETHKEQINEYKKQYYQAHKEQILEQIKKYNEAHKEQINEYQRKYREEKRKLKLL